MCIHQFVTSVVTMCCDGTVCAKCMCVLTTSCTGNREDGVPTADVFCVLSQQRPSAGALIPPVHTAGHCQVCAHIDSYMCTHYCTCVCTYVLYSTD